MSWSERFAAYLAVNGITQWRAAIALGVVQSRVNAWVRGATPREHTRKRIQRWSKGCVPSEVDASDPPPADDSASQLTPDGAARKREAG